MTENQRVKSCDFFDMAKRCKRTPHRPTLIRQLPRLNIAVYVRVFYFVMDFQKCSTSEAIAMCGALQHESYSVAAHIDWS